MHDCTTELLRQCTRRSASDRSLDDVRALAGRDVDWKDFVWLAKRHGVVPLAYRHLRLSASNAIPPDVMQTLETISRITALHNQHLARHLLKLLGHFAAAGIPAVPYRGAVFAVSVYGQLGMRQFGDLDFVVPEKAMGAARALLESFGYENDAHPSYALKMADKSAGVSIELHQSFSERRFAFRMTAEDVRLDAEPVAVMGHEVENVHPEDLLLLLSTGGARDEWKRFGKICDVAALIDARPDINWDALFARAYEYHGERMLTLALRLAYDLLDAPLPEAIVRRVLADETAGRLASQIEKTIFVRNGQIDANTSRRYPRSLRRMEQIVREHAFFFGTLSRRADRARYLMHFLDPRTIRSLLLLMGPRA